MSKPNQDTAKPQLMHSDLTNKHYFVKSFYKDGSAKEKYDVTDEIEALITQAHQKGYDAGFNNQKFISDSQLKRIDKLEAELKREQENG